MDTPSNLQISPFFTGNFFLNKNWSQHSWPTEIELPSSKSKSLGGIFRTNDIARFWAGTSDHLRTPPTTGAISRVFLSMVSAHVGLVGCVLGCGLWSFFSSKTGEGEYAACRSDQRPLIFWAKLFSDTFKIVLLFIFKQLQTKCNTWFSWCMESLREGSQEKRPFSRLLLHPVVQEERGLKATLWL